MRRGSATERSSSIRIDRCVCQRLTFEALQTLAVREGWDLAALRRETGAGDQCGLCRPYLARMYATAETVFTELLPPEEA